MGHISSSTLETETSRSPKFKAQVVYIVNPRSARTNTGVKLAKVFCLIVVLQRESEQCVGFSFYFVLFRKGG